MNCVSSICYILSELEWLEKTDFSWVVYVIALGLLLMLKKADK